MMGGVCAKSARESVGLAVSCSRLILLSKWKSELGLGGDGGGGV